MKVSLRSGGHEEEQASDGRCAADTCDVVGRQGVTALQLCRQEADCDVDGRDVHAGDVHFALLQRRSIVAGHKPVHVRDPLLLPAEIHDNAGTAVGSSLWHKCSVLYPYVAPGDLGALQLMTQYTESHKVLLTIM